MYLVTVDDGDSVFDLKVEDDDLVATIDKLLLEDGHDKVFAERIK